MLKWLADRVMNAGKKDLIVAWHYGSDTHYGDSTKQLFLNGLILTVSPRWESKNLWFTFLISNGGPKAIAIGAEGTLLLVCRGNESQVVQVMRLTFADELFSGTRKELPRSCLVDVNCQLSGDAEFGPLPPFDSVVLIIQAKRIFAPQISFQIPYLASELHTDPN